MRNSVWILWFLPKQTEAEILPLLIGVYRSPQAADEAIERHKDLRGFRDYPEGFTPERYALDKDHWNAGYTSR